MRVALAIAVLLSARTAVAEEGPSGDRGQAFSLGLEAGVVGAPLGHLGIPLNGTEDGFHLPAALDFRWELGGSWALGAGMGLAHSAIGPAVWIDGERFGRLISNHGRTLVLEVYASPGVQLGFAGPDYFARQENAFVGYAYAFGGPPSLAVRTPVGLRLHWRPARIDGFIEGTPIVTVVPAVEQFIQLTVGMHIHF